MRKMNLCDYVLYIVEKHEYFLDKNDMLLKARNYRVIEATCFHLLHNLKTFKISIAYIYRILHKGMIAKNHYSYIDSLYFF